MGGIIIALSVANTLLTALNHPLLKEAFLSLSYGNRLKKLKRTVTTVKHLLLDAANKGELSHAILDYVDKLNDAVYDADDLFDELVTKAQRKQLFDDNIVEKVRLLLSPVITSRKIKKLRSRLKDIADDHAKFGLSISTEPHRRLRVETFSNVYAPDVVGRDGDANKVIGMLLDSNMCVSFLSIAGIGGVGKTTLAKLVFGDKRIRDEFPIRLWVCVSDQDGASLDEKQILLNILKSLKCSFDESSSVDSLQSEYQRNLQEKKFLLVLDDIWSEKIIELDNLKKLLKIDGSKCRIITTTRSKETARIMGNTHELEGLSDEHSRCLFEMVAFQDGEKPPELVEIGEKIVKKSSNVPLAIMVIGSLLYGQPIDKWQTFLTSEFNRFSKGKDEIMSILKISYDNLDPSLKSCFAYCAIFPKDFVIRKEVIINLWDAQGYIIPFDEGQSIENAGEEHFSVLLQRCFFQDVKKNEWGDVVSFKIHDLMHDLAQRVSGNEICVINSSMPHPEYKVRHIFDLMHNLAQRVSGNEICVINSSMPYPEYKVRHIFVGHSISKPIDLSIVFNTTNKSKIRTYLMSYTFSSAAELWLSYQNRQDEDELLTFEIPKNWGYLRALVLQNPDIRIPDTIGNLLHLRYLNLSYSGMKNLPDSIVNLYNLKTLNISYCRYLNEWPREFSKLVNLTHLYIFCRKLSYMPVGMSKLSSIRTLTDFMVKDESASGTKCVGQLIDLKALALNLKGGIHIRIKENFKSTEGYDWEGSCLQGAKHLDKVVISFSYFSLNRKGGKDEEVVMEKLKPHPNLRVFHLISYAGEKITRWGRAAQGNWATFLPNLVDIQLMSCHYLQELPMLSKLRHLKYLLLIALDSLEYMEEDATSTSSSVSLDTIFFPSLETLHITGLQKLKGWWKSSDCNNDHCKLAFPNLSKLHIEGCRCLISFPPCLSNPKVYLRHTNEVLRITTADGVC